MPIGEAQPSNRVIRCLFGPVDHEQRRKELSRLSRALDQRNSQKWNFDFRLESPLLGKYNWEQVKSAEPVPKAYEMANLETVRRFSRVSLSSKCEENTRPSTQATDIPAALTTTSQSLDSKLCGESPVNMVRPTTPITGRQSRKRRRETDEQLSQTQRLITDFYKSVKKLNSANKRRKLQL